MAIALVFGLSQCKKQETSTSNNTEDGKVYITVNVNNGGGRHHIEPGVGAYVFTNGDILYVGNGGHYVGTLTYNNGAFSGTIDSPVSTDYLHFYFLGGKTPATAPTAGTTESFTVSIADQSGNLPVLSYGQSTAKYTTASATYSTTLRNKCALVKFDLSMATNNAVTVANMLTEATINFATPGITPTATTGSMTLYSESGTEKWAILLPQDEAIEEFTINIGNRSYTVSGSYTITNNGYIDSGISFDNTFFPVTSITLNKTTTSINRGATETLSVTSVLPSNATDKTYTWSSDATGVATVNASGVVTAVAVGTAHIRATANDGSGVYGECTVTVNPVQRTVTWNSSTISGITLSYYAQPYYYYNGGEIVAHANGSSARWEFSQITVGGSGNGISFSVNNGNIKKIVLTFESSLFCEPTSGWSLSGNTLTWTGTASSVELAASYGLSSKKCTQVQFTLLQ